VVTPGQAARGRTTRALERDVSPSLSADPTAIEPTTIGTSLNSPTVPRTSMIPTSSAHPVTISASRA
jgi:hypothetical protein